MRGVLALAKIVLPGVEVAGLTFPMGVSPKKACWLPTCATNGALLPRANRARMFETPTHVVPKSVDQPTKTTLLVTPFAQLTCTPVPDWPLTVAGVTPPCVSPVLLAPVMLTPLLPAAPVHVPSQTAVSDDSVPLGWIETTRRNRNCRQCWKSDPQCHRRQPHRQTAGNMPRYWFP